MPIIFENQAITNAHNNDKSRNSDFVVLDTLQLTNNQLAISQAQTVVLTPINLQALDSFFPNSTLFFTASNLQHGNFYWTNGTGPITRFPQSSIQARQIQFTHDGSSTAPSYAVGVSTLNGTTLVPQASTISFNLAPSITTNSLAINRAQVEVLTSQALSATDPDDPADNLVFTVSNITYGFFSTVSQPTLSITSFLQGQITNQQILFTQDNTPNPPGYYVAVSDGKVSNLNGPQPAVVNFNPTRLDTSGSGSNNTTVIGATVGVLGGLALLGGGVFYMRSQAEKQFNQALESIDKDSSSVKKQADFRKKVLHPIAKEAYNQIKISGCLGYLSQHTAKHFITAIEMVIDEVQKQGVDLDIERMTPDNRRQFINEVIHQIRVHTVPETGGYLAKCCRFFKPEVTPTQIEDKVNAIAVGVRDVVSQLQTEEANRKQKISTQLERLTK